MHREAFVRHISAASALLILTIAAAMSVLSSTVAKAAFIVIDPAGMSAIFSQSSFDDTPVEIRFNPPEQIADSGLLDINSLAQLTALVNLAPDPAPVVDAFFVDQLNACGFEDEPKIAGSFAGCAQLPGHVFVEASDFAELSPAPLMGHELGHNLDLEHDLFDSNNLMAPFFPPGMALTEEQVATLLPSPLVQTDPTGQKFVAITPIAIVASEPMTLPLLGASLGMLLVAAKISRARNPR